TYIEDFYLLKCNLADAYCSIDLSGKLIDFCNIVRIGGMVLLRVFVVPAQEINRPTDSSIYRPRKSPASLIRELLIPVDCPAFQHSDCRRRSDLVVCFASWF